MMSARVRRNIRLLEVLRQTQNNPTLRKQLLKAGGPDLAKTICECAENIVRGTVRLSREQRRKLLPYRSAIR